MKEKEEAHHGQVLNIFYGIQNLFFLQFKKLMTEMEICHYDSVSRMNS